MEILQCDMCGNTTEIIWNYTDGWTKRDGKVLCKDCRIRAIIRAIENRLEELNKDGKREQ